MAIPEHEMLRDKPTGKAGRRQGSTSSVVLQRVVQVGQMMDVQGMSLTEIYEWQKRPRQSTDGELSGGGWNYSVKEIGYLMKQARELGASLIIENHRRALISQLRQYYDVKRKALAGGDFRVAFACVKEIGRLRNTEPTLKRKASDVSRSPLQWREILPANTEPAQIENPPTEAETLTAIDA